MERNTLKTLLSASSALLVAAGVLFLCVELFGAPEGSTALCASIACILLSNLFSLLRRNLE